MSKVFINPEKDEDSFFVPNIVHSVDGLIHDSVFDWIPECLKPIVAIGSNRQERDVLLLGAITVISGCLPNIYGLYDNRIVYPNLFAFIDAPAGAGKGILNHLRLIGRPIHLSRIESTRSAVEAYEERKSEMKSKNEDPSSLPIPKQKLLFIPANSSASSFINTLTENDEMGILFSTEADTLANSLNQDLGNFSDVLRCAFHHESVEMQRRANREYLVIEEPRLSVMLTGTNGQFKRLIPNTENGLFSRFMFYTMKSIPQFKDVFSQRDIVPGQVCDELGQRMLELFQLLQSYQDPVQLSLNSNQQEHFLKRFTEFTQVLYSESGERVLATIHRSGLITFRIAMILSTLRHFFDLKRTEPPKGLIHDHDLSVAIQITLHTIQHSLVHMAEMPKNLEISLKHKKMERFIEKLPHEFSRIEANEIGKKVNISSATVSRYLVQGPFERLGYNKYKKSHPINEEPVIN